MVTETRPLRDGSGCNWTATKWIYLMHTTYHPLPLGSGWALSWRAWWLQANSQSIYTISPPSNHWEFVLWSYLSVVSRKTFSSTDLSYHTSPWTCVGYIPPNALNMAYLQQVIKIKKNKGNGPPNQNKDNPHFRNKFRIILDISFFTSLTSRNNGLSNKQSKIRTKKSNQKSPFIQFFFPKKMMQVWRFCCIPSSWGIFYGG